MYREMLVQQIQDKIELSGVIGHAIGGLKCLIICCNDERQKKEMEKLLDRITEQFEKITNKHNTEPNKEPQLVEKE